MAAVVVRTNKLCSNCIYLPAIDLDDSAERRCVVESNDLCSDCWQAEHNKCFFDDSPERLAELRKISPWYKDHPCP